jgi:hypothetical protein
MRHSFAALITVGLAVPALADLPEGNWRLAQMGNATIDFPMCVLKVETKDGKLAADIVDRPAKSEAKLDRFESKGDRVIVVLDFGGTKRTFEGAIDGKDPKIVRGTYGDELRVSRAVLVSQDTDKLPTPAELATARPKPPPPFAQAQVYQNAPFQLRFRAQQSKDVNEKADLLEKAKEAQKAAEEKVPGLMRETVEKHADMSQAVDAASQLVRTAVKIKATPQDVEKWVKLIDRDAAKYGPRFTRDTHLLNAEVLRTQKGMETLALARSYKPADLILIQYHVHIPGPDPLTNEDTVERMSFYAKKDPKEVGGTPSTVFNGKPQSLKGGGPMANAPKKFDEYRDVIDPLLEQTTDVKVTGSARRDGDKLTIAAQADGDKDPGDQVVLRLILLEESVKYVGGNGLRVHHDVVRAFPNGLKGTAVKDGSAKAIIEVKLAEVRTSLSAYLDKYAADQPFPYEDRPMDLSHLKVVALVQDDASGEILNAAQFPVEGK